MKLKTLLLAFASIILALGYTSCKKSSDSTPDSSTTSQATQDQATSDAITQDANDVFSQEADSKGLTGNGRISSADPLGINSCATVSVTPLIGWPKTITIDFGTGCTSANGVVRSGVLTVVLTDSIRRAGSIATMTFSNYYVNGYHYEADYVKWTNTSSGNVSWDHQVVNGKITNPSGRYWNHYGTRHVIQTAHTPGTIVNDVYSITSGTHTVTNMAGVSFTATIVTALEKKFACRWIDQGSMKIQGPDHYVVIDYGAGTCDNAATLAIDGGTPFAITLP
jgi:hypothetical protein